MPETSIERGGWIAEHPLTGEKVHVVTREWFDELAAERDALREFAQEFLRWVENDAPAEEWDGGSTGYEVGGLCSMANAALGRPE